MFRTMCRAKLHGLTVTEARLDYEGSLTLDSAFMDRVELLPYEQVHVLNITTGTRLETYLIPGEPGSRIVCLNPGRPLGPRRGVGARQGRADRAWRRRLLHPERQGGRPRAPDAALR